jgi:hypothetical protein
LTTAVRFESAAWAAAEIPRQDLDVLAAFAQLCADECVARLAEYRLEETAAAWRAGSPRTPAEIRDSYRDTDCDVWELLGWNPAVMHGLGPEPGRGSCPAHPRLDEIAPAAHMYSLSRLVSRSGTSRSVPSAPRSAAPAPPRGSGAPPLR